DFTSWFDLWHTHIDWKARGNRYPESRAEVARATYDLLLYAEQAGADRQEPIQFFAQVCENTGDNAVYVHTENPNGRKFPYEFKGTNWLASAPPELDGVVNQKTHEIGLASLDDE